MKVMVVEETVRGDGNLEKVPAELVQATQVEMEAGIESALRIVSPLRVKQAIDALGGGGGIDGDSYICIRDEKAQNTDGGTFTSGAWRTRVLNTEQADSGNHATLSSNRITLDAGDYVMLARLPVKGVSRNQGRLYNVTDAAVLIIGTSSWNPDTDSSADSVMIMGKFTIAASKALEIQHRGEVTKSGSGFGVRGNFTTEVYTTVQFWKVG